MTSNDKTPKLDYVRGLGTHVFGPQETKVIPFEAEVAFRPEKLIFPPGIGDEFSVLQISIDIPHEGDTCAMLEEDSTSPGSEFGRTIRIKWEGQPGSMAHPSRGTYRGDVTIRNNSDHDALFKGGLCGPAVEERATQKNDGQKDSDEDNLSLLEKAKRWYASGFRQAVEDFRGGRPAPEPREEITAERWHEDATIADMLRSLIFRVIWYARLPLDAAYFLVDQIEIREAAPEGEPVLGGQKNHVLGFGLTSIQPESSANINVQPHIRFKPERLVIPPEIAADFLIAGIQVGGRNQLISAAAIPAMAFSDPSGTAKLELDVCEKGEFIMISVANIRGGGPRNFTAAIFGSRMED